MADLDVLPDLEEVEEDPEEGDDEAGHHHEQEPVVVSQPKGSRTRETRQYIGTGANMTFWLKGLSREN